MAEEESELHSHLDTFNRKAKQQSEAICQAAERVHAGVDTHRDALASAPGDLVRWCLAHGNCKLQGPV